MSTPLRANARGRAPVVPVFAPACPGTGLWRYVRLLLGLALAVSLIGCGDDPAPTPVARPPSVRVATPPPDGTPAPTVEIPTAPPISPWLPMTLKQRVAFFQRVWQLVRDNYAYVDYHGLDWLAVYDEFLPEIENESNPVAFYDLLKAMIDRLDDQHSWFADPDDAVRQDAHQQTPGGDLIGNVGLFGALLDEAFRVCEVVPGSPADNAGIRRSDVLQAVDGSPILNEGQAELLLDGPPGTRTELLIETPGGNLRKVELTRGSVNYQPEPRATFWPGTHIVYLDVPTFEQKGMNNKVHDQLTALADQKVDGLIIDLRENGGGLVREMLLTLGLFVKGGIIGYDLYRDGRSRFTVASDLQLPSYKDKTTVILIDKRSESASEVFSAGMRYRGAAVTLGSASAGNTETVYSHDLPGGARLYLAEARFVLPDDSSIEDVGVSPDIIEETPWYFHPPEEDPQVLAAIKYIQRHPK